MNTQDRVQLEQLLQQLTAAKLAQKDREADNLIRAAFASQPDAAYLLILRCMLQDQALQSAQTQIDELRRELLNISSSSADNRLLDNNPWAEASHAAGFTGKAAYQMPVTPVSRPVQEFAQFTPRAASAGVSGFLGNIATTAAGVVAGSFLFQGIENLVGGHHQSGLASQTVAAQIPEQTIVNNYYRNDQTPDTSKDLTNLASYDEDFFDAGDGDADSDWV
jgi:hypothetical protein